MLEEDKNLLKSLSPVSDNVTDRYYPSGRDDRSHKTVEGEKTVDGLKTLQAYGVILGRYWANARIRSINMHQNIP